MQAQRGALVERGRRALHVAADANHNIGGLDSKAQWGGMRFAERAERPNG
jgi:hypothetical protein